MRMNEYQVKAARTINKKNSVQEIAWHALHGMSAEVGEIHGIYQKRYQGHTVDESELMKEAGDVLWMLAEYCTAMGWELEDVAALNIEKLEGRYPNGFEEGRSLHREE